MRGLKVYFEFGRWIVTWMRLEVSGRLLPACQTAHGTRLWVIMEADRSSTCIFLPEEY